MRLSSLNGTGFRNLAGFSLEFDPTRNIFIGPNGAGKTNLLEAIYYLCIGRSMRAHAEDQQLVGFSSGLLRLEGRAATSQGELSVEVGYDKAEKRVRVNGELQQRLSGLIGRLPVVSLSPEDDELCKGGPAERRRFLDLAISQLSRTCLADLQEYRRVLAHRNKLLADWRDGRSRGDTLDAWNAQLQAVGSRITAKRLAVVAALAPLAEEHYRAIAGNGERLGLRYRFSYPVEPDGDPGAALGLALSANTAFERSRGLSMHGPHRDDLEIALDGQRIRSFGSQGQQRTAAIALKLAEAGLLARELGDQPLVLLDEIFAELDGRRGANLVDRLDPGCQAFIASAHDNGLAGAFRQFRIDSGRIAAG